MKKNDIIELNGKEYTVELNRQSYIAIDKYSNIQKTATNIAQDIYTYVDDVTLEQDPFSDLPTIEDTLEKVDEKFELLKKLYVRAFWVWLYPNHKLNIDEVKTLLNDYFDDDAKFEYISEKYSLFIEESIKMKNDAEQEIKNLKAQANK